MACFQPQRRKLRAVVEVGAEINETVRVALLRAAYRSSRAGVVVLALRGVAPEMVDRALDDVVDVADPDIKGVVYVNVEDEAALMEAAADAEIVVASTDAFRQLLARRGISSVNLHNADLLQATV